MPQQRVCVVFCGMLIQCVGSPARAAMQSPVRVARSAPKGLFVLLGFLELSTALWCNFPFYLLTF